MRTHVPGDGTVAGKVVRRRGGCSERILVTIARDIAEFATLASWTALSSAARDALQLRLLDSLGCALAAHDGLVPSMARAFVERAGGRPTCTLIGGGGAPPDRAAFYNTALIRYLDFNDAYLAPGETCHPSDSLGAVLAAAQEADVAFDIIGGGRAGPKTQVRTKEEADHSLPYLVAVAVLDRQVMPEQFAPERIARDDVQALLRRVVVRPDPALSRDFPRELPCRITIERKDGLQFVKEKRDYLGFHTRPMGREDVSAKFRRLTSRRITAERRLQIETLVANIERAPVAQLCALLEQP